MSFVIVGAGLDTATPDLNSLSFPVRILAFELTQPLLSKTINLTIVPYPITTQ